MGITNDLSDRNKAMKLSGKTMQVQYVDTLQKLMVNRNSLQKLDIHNSNS